MKDNNSNRAFANNMVPMSASNVKESATTTPSQTPTNCHSNSHRVSDESAAATAGDDDDNGCCGSTIKSAVDAAVTRVCHWLFTEGGQFDNIQSFMEAYCDLVSSGNDFGLPLDRFCVGSTVSLHRSQYGIPFFLYKWEQGQEFYQSQVSRDLYDMYRSKNAPFSVLVDGTASRVRIKADDYENYPLLGDCDWFQDLNYTDYLALPIQHQDEYHGAIAWATKKPGGFSVPEIQFLEQTATALSTVLRLYFNNVVVERLLTHLEEKVAERTNELEKANQSLEKANQSLEVANRQVVQQSALQLQHFAMMSHEIRTPLNCILGMSSLLLNETEQQHQNTGGEEEDDFKTDQCQLQESIQMIASSSKLLRSVVDDVLDYTKLEAGKMEISVKVTNLQDMLGTVTKAIEYKAKARNIDLLTCLPQQQQQQHVVTDGRRVQQVLFNVLGNAVKFSKDGSVVEFHVSMLADENNDKSKTPLHHNEDNESHKKKGRRRLLFRIKDYGNGIKKKDMSHIFTPFNQIQRNTQSLDGGTGLGLPITAKIVKGLGGSIHVKSDYGHWCEFLIEFPVDVVNDEASSSCAGHSSSEESLSDSSITLPSKRKYSSDSTTPPPLLATAPDSPTTTRSTDADATRTPRCKKKCRNCKSFSTLRVLVAEDNVVNQKVLGLILKRLGLKHVHVVKNGQEAVDMASKNVYDLVLMDLEMPVMNGLDATRFIVNRRQAHNESFPKIVVLTAHALDCFRTKVKQAGGDAFLSKPYKLEDIQRLIESLLLS